MAFITSDHTRRWPGGCLIWRFHQGLSAEEKDLFRNAMNHWIERANVRFVERTTQSSFVTFKTDDDIDDVNRSTSVGMAGGEQFILLEPVTPDNSRTKSARHEIGHALGFKHEHMRCDRDEFVVVSDKVKTERSSDFEKQCGNEFTQVGDYDFASVMHYNASSGDTTDDSPALSGTDDTNQALFEGTSRSRVSPGDAAGLAELHGGTGHVYQLSFDGQIEKTVRQYSWASGWTTATPFQMDVRNFLLLLMRRSGIMQIYPINADGSVDPKPIDDRDWSRGWTTAIKYAIGPFNYLFLYKHVNGKVHIHEINGDGRIGKKKFSVQLEPGYTSVRHYAVGLSNFLIFLNANTGAARVRSISWEGKVEGSPQSWTGSPGWTCVEPYSAGGNNYLLRLKTGSGAMSIARIRSDGTISPNDTDSRDWDGGWTRAIPYEIAGSAYLLLLKAETGTLHICRLNSNGTVGTTTDRRNFGPGWAVGAIYHVGPGTFLTLIKT